MSWLMVIAGFALLLAGAEVLVRGAVALAERLGVSPLVIGLTVVAFGTSAPELVVSLNAALDGNPGIAIGNIVGSNIANILLILGVAGVMYPVFASPRYFLRDALMVLGATLILIASMASGVIERWEGLGMVALLLVFLLYSYMRERKGADSAQAHLDEVSELEGLADKPVWVAWLAFLIGLGGVLWGADLLVTGGVDIARTFGISEEVIGLTMVAIGTSLPELATTIAAALKKQTDVALGNALGSNIFNVLSVIGIVSIVEPLDVPAQMMRFDAWVMLAAIVVLIPFVMKGHKLGRKRALVLLVAYVAYIAFQFVGTDVPTTRI